MADRRLTIREISGETGFGFGTVQKVLTNDLNMRRVAAKFVPRLLTDDQKKLRMHACNDFKEAFRNDQNFISKVIISLFYLISHKF